MYIGKNQRFEVIDLLKKYDGINPYILSLKRGIVNNSSNFTLSDFQVEYILSNINFTPRPINKIIKIADWYGEKMKEKFEIEFTPEKLQIISILGITDSFYHCYIKYRKNMDAISLFLPKKASITDFLLEDFNSLEVDFDRYDKLSLSKDGKRRLKPHQKEAVKFLLSRKKCILALDMGLGKSTALSVASIEGNFDSIIVICPASLKTNWRDELLWYVPERDITIVDGYNGKTKAELEEYNGYKVGKSGKSVSELQEEAKERGKWVDNRFVIVNFDILDEFYQIPISRSAENIKACLENSPMLRYIKDKKSLIIIDEAHKLSNSKSDRYKIVKDLIKRGVPDSIYLSTGTPITNDPQNYFNLLQLIGDPIANDWNFYMERYCGAVKIPRDAKEKEKRNKISENYIARLGKRNWYELTDLEKQDLNNLIERQCKMLTIAKGATNLEELKDKTAKVYLRRTKEDIGGMPNKTVHEMTYVFTKEQKDEYNRLWDEYEAAQLEADPTKEINKELLEGAIYRKYCSNQMIPNTIKLTESFLKNNEKVVIACCYDEELYTLRDYFGDKCVIYNGKMSLKDKDAAKEAFIKDENKMVFIGNIQAAGVGINLVNSHVLIFNNMSFVPSDNRQMEDRCYRIGQENDVEIYYQFFNGTQYEKMWNIVLRKELIINQVIKTEEDK